MAVTDLTGTTWVFNDTITLPTIEFSFDFTDLSGQTFNGIMPTTTTVLYYGYINDSGSQDGLMAYSNPKWLKTDYQTITITGGTDATNTTLISWLEANATQILPTSFKRYYKNTRLIGTGTYKFRPYTVIQPQLSTPANISADGTTVSWDEVENATSYEILADGTSIGEVENVTEDALAGTWVFNETLELGNDAYYSLSFSSGDKEFYSIGITSGMGYLDFSTDSASYTVYNGEWQYDYKIITINSKLSEVENGDSLLTWLQANATKQ